MGELVCGRLVGGGAGPGAVSILFSLFNHVFFDLWSSKCWMQTLKNQFSNGWFEVQDEHMLQHS
jgi:hypothetical protein